ncbi:MAG: HPr family phosphocarrier protein [Spirochaetales bacterium]|nr:HPr family phosphocarrier protein [Spirochaetales bacterium]
MVKQDVIIQNRAGLHARPASMIVQTAAQFSSTIYIHKEDVQVNAKSIMNLLTLGGAYNTELLISAEGDDEQNALSAIVALFESKFEE